MNSCAHGGLVHVIAKLKLPKGDPFGNRKYWTLVKIDRTSLSHHANIATVAYDLRYGSETHHEALDWARNFWSIPHLTTAHLLNGTEYHEMVEFLCLHMWGGTAKVMEVDYRTADPPPLIKPTEIVF